MKRRAFISAALLGGAAQAALSPKPAFAKDRFRWKMATSWAPKYPILQDSAEMFADIVTNASGGRLKIKVFAGGELIPPLGVFDAVSAGTIECGVSSPNYWIGKVEAAGFFASLPFGMNAQQQNAWLFGGGGLELWRELYAKYNLHPFPFGNTGVQMAGWFKQELKSVSDLKGLKMRIPGYGGKVMARLGTNVVLMAGGEIYTALERGTIDATEWVGPFYDERLGLYRAAKNYYYPGWQEPGSTLELTINKKAWDSLPKDLQAIVETAATHCHLWSFCKSEAENAPALKRMKSEHKVQVKKLPEEILRALDKASTEVIAEIGSLNADTKKIHAAYQAFRKQYAPWSAVSEQAIAPWLT